MKKQIGPWQRLTSEVRYDNPWITVYHEDVITPGNTPGIYGRVHFKGTAVAIIPIDEDGNTWLVGQYRYTLDEYSWEIPMGGCPRNELPVDTAKRELKEETGLSAQHFEEVQKLHTSNSITDEAGFVFLATGLSEGEMELEPTEDISVKKLPFKEAIDWVMQGKITDAISIAALLKVAMSHPKWMA